MAQQLLGLEHDWNGETVWRCPLCGWADYMDAWDCLGADNDGFCNQCGEDVKTESWNYEKRQWLQPATAEELVAIEAKIAAGIEVWRKKRKLKTRTKSKGAK